MITRLLSRASSFAFLLAITTLPVTVAAQAGGTRVGDWPQWGHDSSRNMVSDATGLPDDFDAGKFIGTSDKIDFKTTRNVKWIAKLGSQAYGNPTVANGRVFVGTNNDSPRDPRFKGDRSVVYCFDEQTGKMIWELNVPKMGTGKVSDWEFLGICSSPAVEGNRVYLVTNLCEVTCLDIDGMANGNDGPFMDEAKYLGGKGHKPIEVKSTDADIIWRTNMIDECGVFPHNITSCSVLLAGDKIWTSTSNGVDYGHVETPAPRAPSLIVLDKKTGKVIGEEASGLSSRIFHSNWSSPAYLKTDTHELGIFGGPDGWLYAFLPEPVKDADGFGILKEAWRYDCNPPEYRVKDGKKLRYTTRAGPSEILSTPCVYKGRVYCVIGQDPEHGEGLGNLSCVDAEGKHVWNYKGINRSMSSLAIANDLVFAADFSGFVHCVDANTGKLYWKHDTAGHIWGSPLVADGKVYVGSEDGFLSIIPATKEYDKKAVKEIDMTSPIYSSPIVANGVLYIATQTHLYAIEAKPTK